MDKALHFGSHEGMTIQQTPENARKPPCAEKVFQNHLALVYSYGAWYGFGLDMLGFGLR